MRGKLRFARRKTGNVRITPADAGKTRNFLPKFLVHQDHPRGCGENSRSFLASTVMLGSPPRMRGKLLEKIGIEKENGITPADAGKTSETASMP